MHKRRNYKFKKYKDRKMTEQEKFQWILTAIVFVIVFVGMFIYLFTTKCIFEWPIRWNISVCWHEQIQQAKNEAIDKAANFVP